MNFILSKYQSEKLISEFFTMITCQILGVVFSFSIFTDHYYFQELGAELWSRL